MHHEYEETFPWTSVWPSSDVVREAVKSYEVYRHVLSCSVFCASVAELDCKAALVLGQL